MTASEQTRFDALYQQHLTALKLQGLSDKTIDVYARAVRRVSTHFDCCPDQLSLEPLTTYFAKLVDSHSWSTVKVDRNGLQFFWQHVLLRGFHRVRDYGFLHHNAKRQLQLLQLVLQVSVAPRTPQARPHFRCCRCGEPMAVIRVRYEAIRAAFHQSQGPPMT